MEAYCMKCKEKREAKDAKDVTMKNGKPAQEGTCPVCGARMFRIGAAKPAEAEKAPAEAPAKAAGAARAKGAAKGKAAAK
jgi:hypothetical protein